MDFLFKIQSWGFWGLGSRGGFWTSFSLGGEGILGLSHQVGGEILGGNSDGFWTRVNLSTCPPSILERFLGLGIFGFFLGVFSSGGFLKFS